MAITTINIDSQVLTFANLAAFPITGTVKTIYIAEDTSNQYYWDGSQYELLGSVGTVTSVGLTMPSAFTVSNSPITSSGDIAVTGAGLANQYVRGDGTLANFPTNGGGGSSVNYFLNGSVNQGTFGGDTYYELSRTPIFGAGTNFTRTNAQGNGYIASFITDAGDPNLLNIPAGNWNIELYFNANSGGGSPSFYGELYKVSNTNVFTLIASGSTNPEGITQGTTVDQYFTSIPVPQTTLLATDRLAIRVYVNTGGRNITLHTEDNNLCQVITTFSTGLNALNGLTAQVQNFATGTSGTDFAINSVTDTHTFNLPTASAANRGALSSADWSTFNGKVNTGAITSSGLTMATARLLGRGTAGSGAVEEIVIGSGLTLTGTTLSAAGGGITIGTTAIASGTVGRVLFEGAGNVVQQDSTFAWNNTDKRLILGTEAVADTNSRLVVIGKGTGTNNSFAVHNSTGTNNAFIVRDDGFVSINSTTRTSFNEDLGINKTTGSSLISVSNTNTAAGDIGIISAANAITGNNRRALSLVTYGSTFGTIYYRNKGVISMQSGVFGAVSGTAEQMFITHGASAGNFEFHNLVGNIATAAASTRSLRVEQNSLIVGEGTQNTTKTLQFSTTGVSTFLETVPSNTAITLARSKLIISNNASQPAGGGTGGIDIQSTANTPIVFSNQAYSATTVTNALVIKNNQVAINVADANASAQLDVTSTTRGFLPPRMTTAQRDLIATPAEGLVIYNTTTQVLNFYNGAVWAAV